MQYEIETGGRVRRVAVARTGDGFAVTVDGHTRHVDAVRIDAHTLSLIVDSVYSASHGRSAEASSSATPRGEPAGGRTRTSIEVGIVPDRATGQLTVHAGPTPVTVALNGRRGQRGRKAEGSAGGSGPQRVVAPMPGKVVRVLVAAGEAVRARQPLVVVEAMKMENELRAGREGTVADIHAREGALVDAGALLIVIQ